MVDTCIGDAYLVPKFGAFGGQLRLRPDYLEACLENFMEVTARPTGEEMFPFPRVARSRAEFHGVRRFLTGPDRDEQPR